jgi:5-methylcytosine-specific restriction endonuclease McrA
LTLDHIEPISRGGTTSWDNVVTACKKCNTKKANRTPREAKMQTIRNEYKAPHIIHFLHTSKYSTPYYQEWQEFLFAR